MKVSEHIEAMQKILKENGDLELCYSIDDEGNGFCKGVFTPAVGMHDGDYQGEFHTEDWYEDGDDSFKPNCVCIN